MDWLKDLNPFASGMLILATFTTAIIFLAPKSASNIEKAVSECGLKRISLNQFGRYLNATSCSCLQSMFDGSRFNSPTIGEIYSGKYGNFFVTIFTLVLPTGRFGTWQTVIHLRPELPKWLPVFSIIDEVSGKGLSETLKCVHTHRNPLTNINYVNRHDEAHQLRACLTRSPVNELSISAIKSPLNGIVLDSTGEDLFFYWHGRIVAIDKSIVLRGFIDSSIELWQMIDAGKVDVGIFAKD
ncbi:hypothetical protein KP003_12565 [Geomonas nitrogeniifigens]|uniref:Uncharacterized protein n=1 Tax=Geomonas diazotrophica TaxID=2843197 RepID=A0ABX8JCL8_9BACT|nr:hypothetical protein [Geomonas nitrogeniifigens]QWV96158.1 hypothetical protein KP005_12285 [Geomonas nitrogeniifigens]QXE85225.1 hypothetical protein KP003_12565 [Geomonas nitrogeniifigens]